jgi:hypothetical protein
MNHRYSGASPTGLLMEKMNRGRGMQPQRGCILQPRVAVLGYPGWTSAGVNQHYSDATPTGLHPPAQGCRTRLPWVEQRRSEPSLVRRNPNGVASQTT